MATYDICLNLGSKHTKQIIVVGFEGAATGEGLVDLFNNIGVGATGDHRGYGG